MRILQNIRIRGKDKQLVFSSGHEHDWKSKQKGALPQIQELNTRGTEILCTRTSTLHLSLVCSSTSTCERITVAIIAVARL